jgi:LemA protein
MKGLVALGLVAVVVLGLVFWGIQVNNDLTRKDVLVDEAWSQVENVYQRRLDLVPNLVNTVKGAAEFQQETFTAVTEARAKASSIVVTPEMLNDPAALQRFQQAQSELSGALSRLLATVENYPQLTATEGFRDLMVQLEGTENRIATERRRFNEVVRDFNQSVRVFPASVIAGLRGFTAKAMFEADEGAQRAPKVEF